MILCFSKAIFSISHLIMEGAHEGPQVSIKAWQSHTLNSTHTPLLSQSDTCWQGPQWLKAGHALQED